jgi:DNA-binding GntR family transcriptional regulator
VGEHREIVAAIEAHDARRAAELVARHIGVFYGETLMQETNDGARALDASTLDHVMSAIRLDDDSS